MTPERLGKYEIRGTLGQGAMGVVYDGWDPLILRRVAIKTVSLAQGDDADAAEGVERFRREAQAAGRLQHPNIVSVFDFGETETLAYIVMEFMDGGTLKDVIDRERKLAPARACELMGQVLAALAYSHARGIVHRDVKPANIMLDQHGAVKLGDFGIARIDSSSMTIVGDVLGTPAYMAPEQFLGETADARADIFAAGATLFHLLTGTRPYEGSRTTVRQKVLTSAAAPSAHERAPEVPAALDAVLCRAMARHAADRFQTAAEFAAAVRASLAAPPASAAAPDDATVFVRAPRAEPPPELQPAAAPGKWLPILVGGVALVLAAGGVDWYVTRPSPAPIAAPHTPAPAPISSPTRAASVATPVQKPNIPPQPALNDAARAATLAADQVGCALASVNVLGLGAPSPALGVEGVVRTGEPRDALRQALIHAAGWVRTDWSKLRDFSGPEFYCAALSAVRTAWMAGRRAPGDAMAAGPGGMDLRLSDTYNNQIFPRYTLHDRQLMKPAIGGVKFDYYLRVDDVQADGMVSHIYPRIKGKKSHSDPAQKLVGSPDIASGFRLGEKPHILFPVDKPYGTDLIIAVASSEQLLPGDRPNTEDAGPYLASLRQAIDDAAARGAKLAAGAIPVETQP